jgi:hypothetical protein
MSLGSPLVPLADEPAGSMSVSGLAFHEKAGLCQVI